MDKRNLQKNTLNILKRGFPLLPIRENSVGLEFVCVCTIKSQSDQGVDRDGREIKNKEWDVIRIDRMHSIKLPNGKLNQQK